VAYSQEKDRNREITSKRTEEKAHLKYNFTWYSQNVNEPRGLVGRISIVVISAARKTRVRE